MDVSLFPEGERELASVAEGSTPRLALSPATAYVQIVNQLETGPPSNKIAEISFTGKRKPDTATVKGTVPAGSSRLRTRDPEAIMHRVGNVLGEIAAAAYDAPMEF